MKRKDYKKKKKSSSKTRLFLKIFLFLFLAVVGVGAAYAAKLHNQTVDVLDRSYEPLAEKDTPKELRVEPAKDKVSILLVGVDESDARKENEEHGRSDALILATLNPKQKSVKLVSIPRDSYVFIPKVNYKDKITHAHAYGGTAASIDAVEELFDIPINYYVKMNFNAFIDVVDALGGVEVEVPYERIEKDENDKNAIHLMPGMQRLDGRHALALARTRKLDSDIERGKRQQMILQAMIKEATSVKSITKYGDVISALGDNMKTDMTSKQMLSFIEYVKSGMPEVDTLSLNGYDDWSTGVYYYKLDEQDLEDTKQILKSHLGLIPDSSSLTELDTNQASTPSEVAHQ
ncbi:MULTISPECIES: LCP family protein [Sporosarcina]|uniref:LCP family protein n=1 Tax=Sporosarcina TaxID=1569 RepID=UPI001890C90D|nr:MULTISPECIES: LCP family protein [Sporosarcina]GKV64908.1 LytR family transcriptional regulator [Sporosarcina sp. NCCP-2331]GLB55018.1 LytR family transcriptional regulator [Sporosarcina sp. NCCP-2378]